MPKFSAEPAREGGMVERLLEAAKRGDGGAIERISRDQLQGEAGQAWLQGGQQRLEADAAMRAPSAERQHEPAALAR